MTELKFKVGDRVQINPVGAERYKQPWSNRVKRGLFGEVTQAGKDGRARYDISLDMPKQAKYQHDWKWHGVPEKELVAITSAQGNRT